MTFFWALITSLPSPKACTLPLQAADAVVDLSREIGFGTEAIRRTTLVQLIPEVHLLAPAKALAPMFRVELDQLGASRSDAARPTCHETLTSSPVDIDDLAWSKRRAPLQSGREGHRLTPDPLTAWTDSLR